MKLTKGEVDFFVKRLEVFEMRFTLSGRIIVRDPVREEYLTMPIEAAKRLLSEWFFEGRRHSRALAKRSPREVPKLIDEFFRIAFLAVKEHDQEQLIKHMVSDEIIEMEGIA